MDLFNYKEKIEKLLGTAADDKEFWSKFPSSSEYIEATARVCAYGTALDWLNHAPCADHLVIDQLRYNPRDDRLMFNGDGLFCGMVCEVLLPDGWVTDRLEYDHRRRNELGCFGWYFVEHPNVQTDGLWVRMQM